MRFQLSPKLLLLINVAGVALAIGVVALLYQIDYVVNDLLYGYGLQFNLEWATPYWTFLRLALVLLGCIVALNVFLVGQRILFSQAAPVNVRPKAAVSPVKPAKPVKPVLKTQPKENGRRILPAKRDDGIEIAAIPMVCNKCGKVFTQPLCMFDFASGKPRLVNVCPYCNAVLAVSGNSKGK